jgi:small conductance mechanosensitive channel
MQGWSDIRAHRDMVSCRGDLALDHGRIHSAFADCCGVAGIAAGFAAQSLVKDYFSGFIILLEGQLRVDDIVEIGGHIGVVEEITLRSIRLRDYDGNVIFVPCGNITNVVNMTMEYSRSVIDVCIAYREKTDEALGIMHSVASQMAKDRAFADRIIDEPEDRCGSAR